MKIVWLNKESEESIHSLGEKGYLLHELATKGLPVPRTFLIPSEFLELLMRENRLDEEFEALYGQQGINASAQMQQRILKISIPKEMINAILLAYESIDEERANLKETFQRMGISNRHEPFVAVKSSYMFPQDVPLPKKQITLLNASSNGEVIEAVKHCWASLFSEELLQHHEQYQLGLFDLSTSVLIQQMIYPRKSGTLFVDPQNRKVHIRAGLGLGEAIVSDLVESDSYVLDLESLQVESVDIKAQQWRFTINRSEGKIIKEELSPNEKNMQFLSKDELQNLARLVKDLPLQHSIWIEWCQEQEKFYFINCWLDRKQQKPNEEVQTEAQENFQEQIEVEMRSDEQIETNPIQAPLLEASTSEDPDSYLRGVETPADDSFIKLTPENTNETDMMSTSQENQISNTPVSSLSKQFQKKYLHDVSQLLVSCDMAINALLKEKHVEIYGNEPEERFFELVDKMRAHMEIPEGLAKIRLMRNKYLDTHSPVEVTQVLEAIDITNLFLQRCS